MPELNVNERAKNCQNNDHCNCVLFIHFRRLLGTFRNFVLANLSGGYFSFGCSLNGLLLIRYGFCRLFRIRGDGRRRRQFAAIEVGDNARDVAAGLAVRRNTVILLNALGAGVVSRQGLDGVAVVAQQQFAKIAAAAVDVRRGSRLS